MVDSEIEYLRERVRIKRQLEKDEKETQELREELEKDTVKGKLKKGIRNLLKK